MSTRPALQFITLAILLGLVAAASPSPSYETDRGRYEAIARDVIVFDCDDIHCFRVLVPWVLGRLPGPSVLKWKIYAVMANAGAAVALGQLCLVLGLSRRAATLATWIAAFGWGSLFTLFDCYTSDPLMYLIGPLVTSALLQDRLRRALLVAGAGVMAKEFAAAPLWMFTMIAALQRRWAAAVRLLLGAMTVTLLWFALHTWLIAMYHYTLGRSAAIPLAPGGFLARWAGMLGPRLVILSLVAEFGALWLLFPVGLMRASRTLRLIALAALPVAAVLINVQQPDRALWNFHFIVIPASVLVLEAAPDWVCWSFVVTFGAANLRLGAQLPYVPSGRILLAISLVPASIALVANARRGRTTLGSQALGKV